MPKKLNKEGSTRAFPCNWLSSGAKEKIAKTMVEDLAKQKNSKRMEIVLRETTNKLVLLHAKRVFSPEGEHKTHPNAAEFLKIAQKNPHCPRGEAYRKLF